MLGRENVLKNFSEHRYLREHEQMLWIGKHKSEALRWQAAADNDQTVLDMLDDIYTGLEVQEYRPGFLRSVSGFSAFNSVLDSEFRFSAPSTSSNFEEGERRYSKFDQLIAGTSRPITWDSAQTSDAEWEDIAALAKHHGVDNYITSMADWAAFQGKLAGVKYAEGFRQHLGHSYPQDNLLGKLLGTA